LDRPETGGLSGSTLEETVSWGKMKGSADHVMVIGEALMVFSFLVSSAMERLGKDFNRDSFLQREKRAGKGT
jgi:deoxyhypusine synthase